MAPALVFIAAMTAFPLYVSLTYSFFRTVGLERREFVGLANYRAMISDPSFYTSVEASLIFVIGSLVIAGGLGLALGFLLRSGTRLSRALRTVVVIPWVTSEIATGIMWQWMLNTQYGSLPYAFTSVGRTFPELLSTPEGALTALVLVNVWRSLAFPMLMTIAALQSVPKEIEEAARVDGAGPLRTAWSIQLPMILPVTMVTLIVLTFSYFNTAALVLDLTGGGPAGTSEVLSLRLFRQVFNSMNIGRASVLSVLLIVVNMLLAGCYYWALNRNRQFRTG